MIESNQVPSTHVPILWVGIRKTPAGCGACMCSIYMASSVESSMIHTGTQFVSTAHKTEIPIMKFKTQDLHSHGRGREGEGEGTGLCRYVPTYIRPANGVDETGHRRIYIPSIPVAT